ncbi:nitrogenase FeMo-cofactor carrier protein NifX [Klebsiella michiganensis]|uniref:Nitrogenase FeMo-cofactor carrier protein NifX n=1 Tax=Klebsiella michiganensis TaxID=1134687 RepID=A0A7H4PJB7_9ENTR|nr:nitrogenase FeMo-cofactor carrier protein NifX [Klebsiella michiganensis]
MSISIFGATPRLVVYGVKADRVTLIRVVDFSVENGHQTEKIARRIHALEDCVTLFCVAIGDAVFRQLLQVGVRAERVPADTTIVGLLQEIQLYWYDKGQRKNARQRDPERFTRLLQEQEWHEEPDPRR